jgi:multiple sugar transport system permease protein
VSAAAQASWRVHGRGAVAWRAGRVVLSYAAMLIALLFFLFPYYWMVSAAFKGPGDVTAYPPVWIFEPTMENFVELFRDLGAMEALTNSLIIVGISTCLAIIFGSMAA